MAASQYHPGMAPPGLAQQHMGPMHAHSAGPPMGQPATQGMPPQMHPGMAGPGGPHGNQGGLIMGGLPPGMNPNAAHAMSHLQPQNQMFSNQQIPQGIQQQQQAALAQQRANVMMQHQQAQQIAQQRAAMEQQQRGMHNNMNPNVMQGGPGQGMTQQQMQAIQQSRQQQMQQFNNMSGNAQFQRQQQMQNNMMSMPGAGGQGPPQMPPGPHTQAPQMRSQASMPSMSQGGQVGPLQEHPQQGPGQPNRPQDQSQGPAQSQQGTPQQRRPPPSQQSQAPPNPMQRVPSSQSGQGPQPPQPQAQPQQQQSGANQASQPQNASVQTHTPQSGVQYTPEQYKMHQESIRRAQQQHMSRNHIQAMALQQQQQQMQNQNSQIGIVRLMHFADRLSGHNAEPSPPDHEAWQRLVLDFFTDDAMYRMHLWDEKHTQKEQFGVPQPILARYFGVQFASGVQNISLSTGGARQTDMPNGVLVVECERATFTYLFSNNIQIKCMGPLKAVLGLGEKFQLLEFDAVTHDEFIPSARIRQLFSAEPPQSLAKSPKMSKNLAKQKAQQKLQSRSITLMESDIPVAPVASDGVTSGVKRFLENADTVSQMRDLFDFAQQQNQFSGSAALQHLVETQQNGHATGNMNLPMGGNPQINLPQNQNMNAFNQNGGRPTFNNPFANGGPGMNSHFASPAHGNLGLPNPTNSPHMRTGGSPGHPGGMLGGMQPPMAPQMTTQHSQQGTSSSAAQSSTSSPNVHGKKRRASLAKGDGGLDDGSHQVNGIDQNKGKAPPKPVGKRQKANG